MGLLRHYGLPLSMTEVITMMERERLPRLLNHLMEHNLDHSKELTELAEKAKTVAADAVLDDIREAARLMNESADYLKQALTKLGKA